MFIRRFSTGSSNIRRTFGVAFDVDGVLLRGKEVIPGVSDMLRTMQQRNVPFIFLTNGGGVLESVKSQQLSDMFNVEIDEEQIQCAHSPMRGLAGRFRDDLVLAVGKTNARPILQHYGFRNVVTMGEYHSQFPLLFVDASPKPAERDERLHQPVRAIMCVMDPKYWHREVQIIVDLLRSNGIPDSNVVEHQQIPIYFSNPDFEYVAEWPVPRFGSGVFAVVCQHLYKLTTGKELECTFFGKPLPSTYEYAQELLSKRAISMGYTGVDRIYGVGDNPKSDIAGANAAGPMWRSVLVCTGMYSGGVHANDTEHPAHTVQSNVLDAMQWIYKQH